MLANYLGMRRSLLTTGRTTKPLRLDAVQGGRVRGVRRTEGCAAATRTESNAGMRQGQRFLLFFTAECDREAECL